MSKELPISVHVGMAGTADAVTTLQRYRLLGADVNYVHAKRDGKLAGDNAGRALDLMHAAREHLRA
jgi:hypothetical protein